MACRVSTEVVLFGKLGRNEVIPPRPWRYGDPKFGVGSSLRRAKSRPPAGKQQTTLYNILIDTQLPDNTGRATR